MLSHELNLLCIGGALGDDSLYATDRGLREDVRRGLEAERHDISATLRDLGLTLCVLRSRDQRKRDKGGERGVHRDDFMLRCSR